MNLIYLIDSMKYGLISYDYTTNLGNEIQSIAARRFLPQVDYYVEHEKLDKFDCEDDKVKTIMNGWYVDCPSAWPPSEKIDPLLVSMHFNTSTKQERIDAILSPQSKEYFASHGKVGCRDMHTVEFLHDNGIDAYFTGCLTLTLDSGSQKPPLDEGNEYVVVNMENATDVISYLKEKTDKKIYRIYQNMMPSFKKAFPGEMPKWLYNLTSQYSDREKFFMAENILKVYENASCVITDRLHCALPCLALKTPVMLFNERNMKERFDGISQLLLESTFDEYQRNYNIFDVDNPPENSSQYLKIRNDLIKKCKDFTGHINDSCYSNITYNRLVDENSLILSRNAIETRQYFRDVLNLYQDLKISDKKIINKKDRQIKRRDDIIEEQKQEIRRQKELIKQQEKQLEELNSSKSWKLTSSVRKMKDSFKK